MLRLFMALSMWTALQGAEIVDRIAVTVAKHVITERDVLVELRVAAFLDGTPVDLSGEQKRKSADRLVDQYLLLQEAASTRIPAPAKTDAEKELVAQKARFKDDTDYRATLARYKITESQVLDRLFTGLRLLRFTDLRFRPEIQNSDEDIRESYDGLIAKWRRDNAKEIPSLEASRESIEKMLTEEKLNQALDRWIGQTRSETQILYREAVFQ